MSRSISSFFSGVIAAVLIGAVVPPSDGAPPTPAAPLVSAPHITPAAERAFAERFAFLHSPLPTWKPGWSALPESWDRAFGRPGATWLVSELGPQSRMTLRQVEGGRETRYLVVSRRDLGPGRTDFGKAESETLKEWLWPTRDLPPTDIVYDVTEEILHGKAKPILCDLSTAPARVFALLPTQVERIMVRAHQTIVRGQTVQAVAMCGDASERVIAASIPLLVTLQRPDGSVARRDFLVTSRDGELRYRGPLEQTATAGTWHLVVHCQLNGLEATLPLQLNESAAANSSLTSDLSVSSLTNHGLRLQWNPRPLLWQGKQ